MRNCSSTRYFLNSKVGNPLVADRNGLEALIVCVLYMTHYRTVTMSSVPLVPI